MKASKKEGVIEDLLTRRYDRYYRLVFQYVYNEQDAMDIVQEGAYQAILKSEKLKHIEYADTWICRIMINEAFQYIRKRKREDVDITTVPEMQTIDSYEDTDLKGAIECLEPGEKAIVVLRYFEDMKLEQVAEAVGENVNTVKSRLYRALKKLKGYYEVGGAKI